MNETLRPQSTESREESDPAHWIDSPWFAWPWAVVTYGILWTLIIVVCAVGFVVLLPFALVKLVWDFVDQP